MPKSPVMFARIESEVTAHFVEMTYVVISERAIAQSPAWRNPQIADGRVSMLDSIRGATYTLAL